MAVVFALFLLVSVIVEGSSDVGLDGSFLFLVRRIRDCTRTTTRSNLNVCA